MALSCDVLVYEENGSFEKSNHIIDQSGNDALHLNSSSDSSGSAPRPVIVNKNFIFARG